MKDETPVVELTEYDIFGHDYYVESVQTRSYRAGQTHYMEIDVYLKDTEFFEHAFSGDDLARGKAEKKKQMSSKGYH